MSKPGVGDAFQEETKYVRGQSFGGPLDWSRQPETYKRYPSAPRVTLSTPQNRDGAGLWDCIRERRSMRRFSGKTMSEPELSLLLWAAQGITQVRGGHAFRAAPSAGALYPIETYLSIHNVQGIAPGIYHYAVETHELEQLRTGDFRLAAARAALDQEMVYHSNVLFIWTAVFERSKWKYRQRAYRYIYLDAGHIAQNVALGAVALGLGSCQIAALFDGEANEILGVDGTAESTVYMTIVGKIN